MNDPQQQVTLSHQSGINERGEPFIQLLHNKTVIGQLNPQEAREHARAIIEAAEASEQDAFMFDFARTQIGLDDQSAYRLILAFREYRQKTTHKHGGPTRPEDWVMPPNA